MNDGTFGMCEECVARIPETRLNAMPYATRYAKCASQRGLAHQIHAAG